MLTSKWIKAQKSASNGNCVEVRLNGENIQVRDTKNRDGHTLSFTHDEWAAFVNGAKDNEFDL